MIKGFKPRLYQETIFATANKKNTLVVLPTGLGKTIIAVMVAASRLQTYPQTKTLILAPTKPLCDQHYESIKKHLAIDDEKINVFTGTIKPEKRAELFKESQVIISTPQGLENDILSKKIDLKEVSLLVVDEAHRAVGDYSYVFIAKKYFEQSDYQRVLALTASPGSNLEKIKEVCQNLYIEDIELKSMEDPDVKDYVKEVNVQRIHVELPEKILQLKDNLTSVFNRKLTEVKNFGFLTGSIKNYTKTQLLTLQRTLYFKATSGEKDFSLLKSISLLSEALKLEHALILLETQGLSPLKEYLEKLEEESKRSRVKAVKNLVKDPGFIIGKSDCEDLIKENIEHPKLSKLRDLIKEEIKKNSSCKLIIFNQYRDSSAMIKKLLDEEKITSQVFFGQAKKKGVGLSQKKQKQTIQDFRDGKFSCLIATSVAEEGLDIPQVDTVFFYEPVPSAIRSVQRRGRTGRQEKGSVKILITKNTRDEAIMWSSFHKEKRMHKVIKDFKRKISPETLSLEKEKQTTLLQATKEEYSKIKIYADYREKGSNILKYFSDLNITIELKRLEVGDYLLSDRVIIEYKKAGDFIDSILDGRLMTQLRSLRRYERPIIVIEGEEDLYSQRQIHPNAIRGALTTIAVSYGIPIVYTKNPTETAKFFLTIAKKEQDNKKKDFSLHSSKPITDKETQEYIVSAFPGVGGNLSKPILQKFKTIKDFVNSSEEELKKIDLIGDKKAKRIKDLIEMNYYDNFK
jgi:ERCC4-related helicase